MSSNGTTTLHQAHKQWANRPEDETFDSLEALHRFVRGARSRSAGSVLPFNALRVEAVGDDVALVGRLGAPARLSHWSFGQLAGRVGAPPSYMRQLPPTLAAQCLNHGLKARGDAFAAEMRRKAQALAATVASDVTTTTRTVTAAPVDEDKAALLFERAAPGSYDGIVLRAVTTDSYARIWNSDITERLMQLVARQPWWHGPKAYDRHAGKRGKPDDKGMVTRGFYASDRDMFVFMVDEGRPIYVAGAGNEGIRRGFFISNSEVGAASFTVVEFVYDFVCGNHYVWGARDVTEIRVRHVGEAPARAWSELELQLVRYAEGSSKQLEEQIAKARMLELGATKDQVLDAVLARLARKAPDLSRKLLGEAYDVAERTPRYGSPRSPWALASGITELSQRKANNDDRLALDRAAGKLIEIAF